MTAFSRLIFLLPLLVFQLSSPGCQAAGTRGAGRHMSAIDYHSEVERRLASLTKDYTTPTETYQEVNCEEELSLEIVCQEGASCQDFTTRRGTCESKMFQYHGGPCRAAGAAVNTVQARQPFIDTLESDTAANCQDYNGGPPALNKVDVFVVISSVDDPSKNSSMWTTVGEYFWTDYEDYPVGEAGLGDSQNITFYASEETSYETMLQSMIFYAPCEGTENFLNALDRGQSVQLIGTAVDPTIQASFEFHITSNTDTEWQLTRLTMATSATPPFEVLNLRQTDRSIMSGDSGVAANTVALPYSVEFDRAEHLSILVTALAVTEAGLECRVSGLFDSPVQSTNTPSP